MYGARASVGYRVRSCKPGLTRTLHGCYRQGGVTDVDCGKHAFAFLAADIFGQLAYVLIRPTRLPILDWPKILFGSPLPALAVLILGMCEAKGISTRV